MEQHKQRKSQERHSVLDSKEDIGGLPSKKKSSVVRAAKDKHAAENCESALDGPACIEGVPEKNDEHN